MKDVNIFRHWNGDTDLTPDVSYTDVDYIIHNAALEIINADDTRFVWPVQSDFAFARLIPTGSGSPAPSTAGSRKATLIFMASYNVNNTMWAKVGPGGANPDTGPNPSPPLVLNQVDDVQYNTSFIVINDGEIVYVINPLVILAPILLEPVV